jgi:effector-binding domain-containing protein
MSVDQIPIGTFSFMTRLSKKALRLYDQSGVLVPEAKDAFTGYRYYTCTQLEKGMKIKSLLFLGFSLEESSKLLDAESTGNYGYIEACFREKIGETQTEIKQMQSIIDILQNACGNNGKITELFKVFFTEPVIKETSEMRVVSKREKGTFAVTIERLIGDICTCVCSPENQQNRVKITGPFMLLCHDEEYKETDADIEIALPISGKILVEDPKIEIKTLPATRAISAVCVGPYYGVEVVYNRILSFAKEKNMELFDLCREPYLNNPTESPEEEFMTEIQIQVREK